MSPPPSPVAIVTGSSTGIGRSTALLLARRGYRVFATVRLPAHEASLREAAAGLPLDVLRGDLAEAAAPKALVAEVLRRAGRVDLLVNNAGYALLGAVEDLPMEALRRQFEVNVFALVQMCREVLPTMRAQRSGSIVNVSSLAGRVSVPLMGAYCATKFAVEAFSDALRVEVKPFGVRVALVEPGLVATQFDHTAVTMSRGILQAPSAFSPVYRRYIRADDAHPGMKPGASPDRVARIILRAARPHARARYRPGIRETLIAGLTQVIPKGAMDVATVRFAGLQRLGRS